jgi:phosphoglycolate phosphatase-like HAD superfamily hydrolase
MSKLPFKPEIILFDFDGTLVYHEHDFILSETERLIKKYGLPPVERDQLKHYFALHDFTGFYSGEEREKFSNVFWEDFEHHNYPAPRLFDGIDTTLGELCDMGIKCALATARVNDQFDVRGHLEELGVLKYFSYLGFRSSHTINWKDKTETIKRVCEQTNCSVSRSLIIGDTPVDIESGKRVGIGLTVAVRTGGIYDDVLLKHEPDMLIDSANELPKLF